MLLLMEIMFRGMVEDISITFMLEGSVVDRWASGEATIDEQIAELKAIHQHYSTRFSFPEVEDTVKQNIVSHVVKTFSSPIASKNFDELRYLHLGLVRMLARDRARSDLQCFVPLTSLLVQVAGLIPSDSSSSFDKNLMLEAEKCLVNILFNSYKARAVFEKEALDSLTSRISAVQSFMLSSNDVDLKQFSNIKTLVSGKALSKRDLKDLLFFDLKIAFVTSAQVSRIQEKWVAEAATVLIFLQTLKQSIKDLVVTLQDASIDHISSPIDYQIASEVLKVLFNVYCHAKLFDVEVASQCAKECIAIVQVNGEAEKFDWFFELKQNAVNLLAITFSGLLAEDSAFCCPKLSEKELIKKDSAKVLEGCDMQFVNYLLVLFEHAIDRYAGKADVALLGTFFTALIHLCTYNKQARRFCRLKVLPPLTAAEVGHAPESGETLRNKIIRIIQQSNASNCHELSAEFLFVLCKRSVNRLIKYCGFGHSAGLLANYGFLGSASLVKPKSQSDSEDSETEDYRGVEDKINPVTGFIPSRSAEADEMKKAFDAMSEEQKEFEAMKLVDAINKLMDEGMVAPATIGEDGRPKKVEHIAELVKNIKPEDENSDSE